MNKWLVIGGICLVGFFLMRGNGKFGANANSDDMRATAAVSLAAGTFDSGEDVTPVHKVPRSKCEHCNGTGKIVSGDGLFKQDCPYCEPDKIDEAAPIVPKTENAKSPCAGTPDCKCEICKCQNSECLKCDGQCDCGKDCKCTNKECRCNGKCTCGAVCKCSKDKECLKATANDVKENLPEEDRISVAQAALKDAAAHYKKGETEDAARAVVFASEVLSANNFAAKSGEESELLAVQQKIEAAKRNLRNKGVDLDTVIVLNRAEYEAFLVKYYNYQKEVVQMRADFTALQAKYAGAPLVGEKENSVCGPNGCGASNNGMIRVFRYNQNFNGGESNTSCGAGGCSSGGGGCASCGRGIW